MKLSLNMMYGNGDMNMKINYMITLLVLLSFIRGFAFAETDVKNEPDTLPVMVEINTTNFKVKYDKKCNKYKPDYSKYHTIIHLISNSAIVGERNGEKTKVYFANIVGTDPISGQRRRMSYSLNIGSIFLGAGTRNNPARMDTGVGAPGTRITFDGDEKTPFEPIPGLRVWSGAIDIDPDCGMIVHAKRSNMLP